MAYHKRDYLYPSNNRRETLVILTKHGVLETCAKEDDPEPLAPDGSSEFTDTACDVFYEIRDFAENQGLPLLQLCRFPDFLDFVIKNPSPTKNGT